MQQENQIEEKIIAIIADRLKRDISEIKLESHLVDDLGVDSLGIVEIMMDLEEEYGVSIPDEEAQKLLIVKNIIAYIKNSPLRRR